jgi:hypothetical protein
MFRSGRALSYSARVNEEAGHGLSLPSLETGHPAPQATRQAPLQPRPPTKIEWPAIDTPGTEPNYLRAERGDAWSLAVSWRGVSVAAMLFDCLAFLAAYFH